jgi:hypothetical protein
MNLLFSSTTSTMNLLWLLPEFGVVLLIADRGTAYVWVETTSNSFSGLLGLGGSKCFGGVEALVVDRGNGICVG